MTEVGPRKLSRSRLPEQLGATGLFTALASMLRGLVALGLLSGLPALSHAQADGYSAEELAELEALNDTVRRFENEAFEYRQFARDVVEQKYQDKRQEVFKHYEK